MTDDGEFTDRRPPVPDASYTDQRRHLPPAAIEGDADLGLRSAREIGYLDRQFGQSSLVMLLVFPLVAGVVALVFALLGVVICRDPAARRNAWIVLAISLVPAAGFVALLLYNTH